MFNATTTAPNKPGDDDSGARLFLHDGTEVSVSFADAGDAAR